jgi:cbb3-type cytochrome oxidase subunit 3
MIELTIDYEILTVIATMIFVIVLSGGAIFMLYTERKENKK